MVEALVLELGDDQGATQMQGCYGRKNERVKSKMMCIRRLTIQRWDVCEVECYYGTVQCDAERSNVVCGGMRGRESS